MEQARSLILSNELTPGNYGITLKTLQQVRGLCVHWLTCNLFWHCLCQPIDLLLAHESESGLMVCCGEVEVWLSFFNALTLARSLAQSDDNWKLLFQCSLERLQVMQQRLSGTMENHQAIWTSGDATLDQMAGINWKSKEYFRLSPEDLLSDFHQGDNRTYQIAEVELITSVGIVVFWGDIWQGNQVILLGTDNQNTFSWLDNKTAKKGLALRITATLHVWCIKNGIEVYPFYLRSLRNIRPDFISRESNHDIECWATRAGYTRVEKPWWWKPFVACAPKLDWLMDRVLTLPKELSIDDMERIGKVAEWRPKSGIALQIFDRLRLDYHAIGGLELFKYYQDDSVNEWKLVFGSARHQGEIEEFRQFIAKTKVETAVMMTPSEVEDGLWYLDDFWTKTWKCDSAKHGDCLVGSWNVYVRSKNSYGSLESSCPGRMLSNLRRVFDDHGLRFLRNPWGGHNGSINREHDRKKRF